MNHEGNDQQRDESCEQFHTDTLRAARRGGLISIKGYNCRMSAALVPAKLDFRDQTPYSASYGDVYHSAEGGIAETQYVFLQGNGLPQRWSRRERFVVLETGFGFGLNFLVTWQAWKRDPER